MSTPKKGPTGGEASTACSPKHFRWTQVFEDTLLELLLREARVGNRPDSTFTATAFRNVIEDFNRIHGVTIMKKHVHSRIKTMKAHFVLFHGAFNGLSGFSWNLETKKFEAEDSLWEQRIVENPKLEKLRDKSCWNWDKLYELYGGTRATGSKARGLKEKAKALQRDMFCDDVDFGNAQMHYKDHASNDSSSYGEHDLSKEDTLPTFTPDFGSKQQSTSSRRISLKRKSSLISVMESGYNKMSDSLDKLSTALMETGNKVANSKFDVDLNASVYDALSSLGLQEEYKVRCYSFLCDNASQAAKLVAAPSTIRAQLLVDIMKETRHQS